MTHLVHRIAQSGLIDPPALLAALYDIFGFYDCAAELIVAMRDRFPDPDALLDLLARERHGMSYADDMVSYQRIAAGPEGAKG